VEKLRRYIQAKHDEHILLLLAKIEEMHRDTMITQIAGHMEILLVHLIKQAVEKKTTRAWDIAIRNAVRRITRINKRRRTGGGYLTAEELTQALEDSYDAALDSASLEVMDGHFSPAALSGLIKRPEIIKQAFKIAAMGLIASIQTPQASPADTSTPTAASGRHED
jgi:hypothetical protein